VLVPPSPGQPLTLVRITQDGEQAHYWVEPLASDFGLAYRLEKPGTEGDLSDWHCCPLSGKGPQSALKCTPPGTVPGTRRGVFLS
jgi:hypothetical protein